MNELMSASDAAKLWHISQRRVSDYCSEGRIDGATLVGNSWVIPKGAKKPIDGRITRFQPERAMDVKPFIKWAGGKGQLLADIRASYPPGLGTDITKYAEPFIGGGAVLFDILSTFKLDAVYISDINRELINTYRTIRDYPDELISVLKKYSSEHIPLDEASRKVFFYKQRDRFNELKLQQFEGCNIELAALFIYLNRTCFNGLYRVNRAGLFNVPSGTYKNPTICDENNIKKVSACLQNVEIVLGDYRKSLDFIDENTFVYFDPPYRPITKTASFTAYTEGLFDDENQKELAEYVQLLTEKGAKVAVSNSDPKNTDSTDEFFDRLYDKQNISRIKASRNINSKGDARGKINELLITNYEIRRNPQLSFDDIDESKIDSE